MQLGQMANVRIQSNSRVFKHLIVLVFLVFYIADMRFLGILDSELGARGNPFGVSIYVTAPLSVKNRNPSVAINILFLLMASVLIWKKYLKHWDFWLISPVAATYILALIFSILNVYLLIYERKYSENCIKLEWVKVAPHARNVSSERVLVAQTTGPSSYHALLDATRPANEAYALRNGYDFLAAIGIFYGTKESHATFNKAFLLELALARGEHSVLLSLDADALVVDPHFAPPALLPNATLLAASPGASDAPHTWDVNAGVLVWNLSHPRAREVSAAWAAGCRDAVARGDNDDQTILHSVLRALGPEAGRSLLNTLVGEDAGRINYDGVHIKHFIRASPTDWTGSSVSDRAADIERTARRLGLPVQPKH